MCAYIRREPSPLFFRGLSDGIEKGRGLPDPQAATRGLFAWYTYVHPPHLMGQDTCNKLQKVVSAAC